MGLRSWLRNRPRFGVAFSDRFVVAWRDGQNPKVSTRELPTGAIVPSPVTPNIESVRDVAKCTAELVEALGRRRPSDEVVLVLPDMSVTTALVAAPAPSSDRELEKALGARLQFPLADARCDFWRGSAGEVLGAGVRTAIVGQYESVLEAAACRLGWVDAASLARLPQWSRGLDREASAPVVWVQLYGSHYFLTASRSGELFDLRLKLRSPGDVETVAAELGRLPKIYDSVLTSLTLSGEDARECAELLMGDANLGALSCDLEGEDTQLVAAIRALVLRS